MLTGDNVKVARWVAEEIGPDEYFAEVLPIAIGAGTDVAVETARIVLVQSNPQDVAAILKLSRAT